MNMPTPLKVIAKGHLLLESMPTQQTKIICSCMHRDETRSVHVTMYVFAISWSGCNQGMVRSNHARL